MKEKGNTPIIVANTMWDLPKTLVNEVKAERMINAQTIRVYKEGRGSNLHPSPYH